jgi:hypothetical protein
MVASGFLEIIAERLDGYAALRIDLIGSHSERFLPDTGFTRHSACIFDL